MTTETSARLPFLLDPGNAPDEEIIKVFCDISQLYRLLGGCGLSFEIEQILAANGQADQINDTVSVFQGAFVLASQGNEHDELIWRLSRQLFCLLLNSSPRLLSVLSAGQASDDQSGSTRFEQLKNAYLAQDATQPTLDETTLGMRRASVQGIAENPTPQSSVEFLQYARAIPEVAEHLGKVIVSLSNLTMNYGLEISAIDDS